MTRKFPTSTPVWIIILIEYVMLYFFKNNMTMLLVTTLVSALVVDIVFSSYIFYRSKKLWLLIVAFLELVTASMHIFMCIINIIGYASAKPMGWWVVSAIIGVGFAAICTKAKMEVKIY